ncbi:tetratricopeptide repeat protein [Kitasatospora sp. NPDC002227]|uniref:tetratricopeptide repeat protein n=1 Tax=Kitasatospora sp. NPDC002227 TaxID=3154773 RepID=UPI00332458E1
MPGWPVYVGAVAGGAAAAAVSQVWLSGAPAVGVGALASVLGFAADRVAEGGRSRAELPAGDGVLRGRAGRVPLVRQLDDPVAAGVHPAEWSAEGAPAYIARDAEPELRSLLAGCQFVLLVGESAAGKTRLAYESVRALYPDHRFVRPLGRTDLSAALRLVGRGRRPAVLWLDDLEGYLGAGGLTEPELRALLAERVGRAVVVATMRAEEHRRYDAREESRLTGSDRDLWRTERGVVQAARVVRVARRWSGPECERARLRARDPRIERALRSSGRFGVSEVLASGPALLDSWRDAWAPGANPRGAALVAAAVDCRRLGLRRPLPQEWLAELHLPYLAERGGEDLKPEPLGPALAWAGQPAHATSSLLTGSAAAGWTAFDYLLDGPGLRPVPDHLWDGLLPRLGAADCYDLGLVAHQEARLAHAAVALRRARDGAVPGADFALALVLGDSGHPAAAARALGPILAARTAELGPAHPETLAARHQLAYFTAESGSVAEAVPLFEALVVDAGRELGADHADTLAARHQLAYYIGESGDLVGAVRQLRVLLADRERVLGSRHAQTLATRRGLAWFRGCSGELLAAQFELSLLGTDAAAALGADDPHTMAVRGAWAWFALQTGQPAEAAAELAALAADRARVLGPDHPHTLSTRLHLAHAQAALGDPAAARAAARALLADAERVLERGHPRVRSIRAFLAGWAD